MTKGPLIIAHRGDSVNAPENTLAAFRRALSAGADGLEFDVQLAKDGVAVVIHDYDLRRTAGRPSLVADLSSRQLAKTDVGSWFSDEFAGEGVPTLAETLELLSGFSGRIYVELKCELDNYKRLVAAVCSTIRDSGLGRKVIVKSFRLAALPEIKSLLPEVTTAALFDISITKLVRRREGLITIAREFSADSLSLHSSLASESLCHAAAAASMNVAVWTVDDQRWITRARDRNIESLITNDPARMRLRRGVRATDGGSTH